MKTSLAIVILVLILIMLILALLKFYFGISKFTVPDPATLEVMKRPFLNIYDDQDRKLNVVFITHPFTRPETIKEYEDAKIGRAHV